MPIRPYLAMTAAEISLYAPLPEKIAWMACHFSPGGEGLSNCPRALPPGSLLILDDSIPPEGQDPGRVAGELLELAEALHCDGILLDLQRQDTRLLPALCRELSGSTPCPVAVSCRYADFWDGALFLPPLPLHMPPEKALAPWSGRELWLELSREDQSLRLTGEGCRITFPAQDTAGPFPHQCAPLFCSYRVDITPEEAVFSLHRSEEDQAALLTEAASLGVTRAVGLYQEFRTA